MFTSLEWQPYADSKAQHQGESIEKLRKLLEKEGVELKVEFFPWKRAQELARRDTKYVGYYPAWPEEVSEEFVASEAVDWSQIDAIARHDTEINYSSLEALFKEHKVGIISTYDYPDFVVAASKKAGYLVRVADEASLANMLSSGRIAVAITDPNVMNFMVERQSLAEVRSIANLAKQKLVFSFKKDEQNLKRRALLDRLLKVSKQ